MGCPISFYYYHVSWKVSELNANSVDPDQTPRSAASDLGLHCLPMPHLWDVRLNRVRQNGKKNNTVSNVFVSFLERGTALKKKAFYQAFLLEFCSKCFPFRVYSKRFSFKVCSKCIAFSVDPFLEGIRYAKLQTRHPKIV